MMRTMPYIVKSEKERGLFGTQGVWKNRIRLIIT